MKTQKDKTQELKSAILQAKKEPGTGGTATIADNRPSAIHQRKLQETMNASVAGKEQPIQQKPNNTGLPDNLKSGIENLSGYSMDDVKVHYNSDKPAQLQAHAYAQGTDIHIAPGQEKHLPHEAWHVVQQKQGRVKPTTQLKGKVNVNDDAGLEQEADMMGDKAVNSNNGKKGGLTGILNAKSPVGEVLQKQDEDNLRKAEEDTELEYDIPLRICDGNVFLFQPAGQVNEAIIYAHGWAPREEQEKYFPVVTGVTLRYFAEHGSITQAGLADNVGHNGNRDAEKLDLQRKWHNYELTKEQYGTNNLGTLQRLANESNRCLAVVMNNTTTAELVNSLHQLGYNWILGLHCREIRNEDNRIFDVMTNKDITREQTVLKHSLEGWWKYDEYYTGLEQINNVDQLEDSAWVFPSNNADVNNAWRITRRKSTLFTLRKERQ